MSNNNQYQAMKEGQAQPTYPAYSQQQAPHAYAPQSQPIYIQPAQATPYQPTTPIIVQQQQQQQQPVVVIPCAQAPTTTLIAVQPVPQYAVVVPDDPSCLYVSACFGFFFPLIGLIMMAVFGCGHNLPPRQAQAYKTLVFC
eukprot:492641_1